MTRRESRLAVETTVPRKTRRSILGATAIGGISGCLESGGGSTSTTQPQREAPDVESGTWVTPDASSAEINDAIDAAFEAGTSVAFAPGTYELAKDDRLDLQNPAAIRCRDGVDLIAPYGGVTLERVDTMHNMIYAGFDPDTGEPHASNFRIEGFEVVGHRDGYEDPVDSHVNSGIMLYGFAENVTIANNHVYDWHAHGIHADVTSNSRIVGNTIHDCYIGIHPATRNGQGPHHTTIAHNTVRDCDGNGLDGGENTFCTYVGNTVENCPGGCNVAGSHNAVVGNTLRGNGEGIGVHFRLGAYSETPEGKYNVATGNVVENFALGARTQDSHAVFATNTFRNIQNRVVWVNEGAHGTHVSDVRVDDGPGYGVLIEGANDVTVENVRIAGSGNGDLVIDGNSADTLLSNVEFGTVEDEGLRTAMGGEATNDGVPSNGGEWNGHADRARQLGVTVWDVSANRPTAWRVDPTGTWRHVG